ncbi:hypothetical protein [Leptospira alstonii]|uniref:Uncharacterized protein n=2 Tax=Leptospira alstonii TaxID=28452 RepID=M6CGV4_9LEPT|nr:hypothetical protein [Leptospira alstonii]EMJ90969.1 hypothetical protein LEP1GSC194_1286 [Leptospira alstonii serovar Sichuan str. 79601]EQA81858.1 hypothetical protein LEP1GSC193_1360 [Leptospira alstonii serovar Pingchang str. 80-412]
MVPIFIVVEFSFLILSRFLIFKIDFYENKKNENEYKNFLLEEEGQNFFRYTSRESSKYKIKEELISWLDDVNILYLNGKEPESDFLKIGLKSSHES